MFDVTLTDAMPVLAATVLPALLILAAVFTFEWDRLGQPDADADFGHADYAAPTAGRPLADTIAAIKRRHVTVTATAPDILPPAPAGMDAGSPLYVALTARKWLREMGEQARAELAR